MVRLVCIVEIAKVKTIEEAQARLDHWREATLPALNHGITIYRATERDADTAIYLKGGDHT